ERIERSAELKRALIDFASSSRFDRQLTRLMLESAGPGGELDEGEAITIVDQFALQHRLLNGKTVLDQFLASRRDLATADRELLRGWSDPVEGLFEILGPDGDAIILLNLLDDLEYRTYSNMGPAIFRQLPKGGFVHARLVAIHPVPDAWLVSGMMQSYGKSSAPHIAQAALEMATRYPALVFRNPEKIEQGWTMMRHDRAEFIEFFGTDELVLPPAEAQARLAAYYQHRQVAGRAFEILPPELADADTIGVIYDEVDGLNFYNDYRMLRDLFANPGLASDKRYSDVLRGYLNSRTVGPLPFRRLAAAYPEAASLVFQRVLRKPGFSWPEHGEALLLRRKPWYYEREPRPAVSVAGTRLAELATLRERRDRGR
ncbi:MAG: hypothetical protein JWM19_7471, partial [Actinomycetia bacterium]|nr:hypothetical protein [Actinomycetes bacterium]